MKSLAEFLETVRGLTNDQFSSLLSYLDDLTGTQPEPEPEPETVFPFSGSISYRTEGTGQLDYDFFHGEGFATVAESDATWGDLQYFNWGGFRDPDGTLNSLKVDLSDATTTQETADAMQQKLDDENVKGDVDVIGDQVVLSGFREGDEPQEVNNSTDPNDQQHEFLGSRVHKTEGDARFYSDANFNADTFVYYPKGDADWSDMEWINLSSRPEGSAEDVDWVGTKLDFSEVDTQQGVAQAIADQFDEADIDVDVHIVGDAIMMEGMSFGG